MSVIGCGITLGWHALNDPFFGPLVVSLFVVTAMAGVTAVRFLRFLWRSIKKPL